MKAITVETLRTWLEEGHPVTVLDIRPAHERAEWAIPGSMHVDAYDALKANDPGALANVAFPTGTPVVTVCAAGKTSQVAARQLEERGIQALSLDGGMNAWSLAWNVAEVAVPASTVRVVQVRRTGKGCLSYLVSDGDTAAVIDASLDPQVYLHLAHSYGWQIAYVLDTHIHADHLSRSRQLAQKSGATLLLPEQTRVAFACTPIHDGDALEIGRAMLTALRTPGHTPESTSYLLDGKALFTGDTLFVDAVGRPDLHASAEEAQSRAHTLYHSIQRILRLPAGTIILPGHSSRPIPFDQAPLSTALGNVRARLGALLESEDAFVTSILARIPPTPPNYERIIACNEAGLLPEQQAIELEAGANRCAIA